MQIESNLPSTIDVEARLDQIAKRYKSAGGVGINVLNVIGGSAEGLIDKLPSPVRRNLESATVKALGQAMKAATSTRSMVPDQKSWLNQAVSAAMGAAGGAGSLAARVGAAGGPPGRHLGAASSARRMAVGALRHACAADRRGCRATGPGR